MNRIKDARQHPFWITETKLIDDGHMAIMGASAFAVYSCLLRHANKEGGSFPSYELLARETGMARATVARAITKLIESGYIHKARRMGSNLYTILPIPNHPGEQSSNLRRAEFNFETVDSSNLRRSEFNFETLDSSNLRREADPINQIHLTRSTLACKQGKNEKQKRGEGESGQGEMDREYQAWLKEEVSKKDNVRNPEGLFSHILSQGENAPEWRRWLSEEREPTQMYKDIIEELING